MALVFMAHYRSCVSNTNVDRCTCQAPIYVGVMLRLLPLHDMEPWRAAVLFCLPRTCLFDRSWFIEVHQPQTLIEQRPHIGAHRAMVVHNADAMPFEPQGALFQIPVNGIVLALAVAAFAPADVAACR